MRTSKLADKMLERAAQYHYQAYNELAVWQQDKDDQALLRGYQAQGKAAGLIEAAGLLQD